VSEGWGIGRQKGKGQESGNPSVGEGGRSGRPSVSVSVFGLRVPLVGFSNYGTGWLIVDCPGGTRHPPSYIRLLGAVHVLHAVMLEQAHCRCGGLHLGAFRSFRVECNTNRRFAEAIC
jgi:hypothetical protein